MSGQLSSERIQALAGRKGVRANAVSNFLMTLGELTEGQALGNLELDAALYGWNSATQSAIRAGIREAFRR